jgi:hypothetical protein
MGGSGYNSFKVLIIKSTFSFLFILLIFMV